MENSPLSTPVGAPVSGPTTPETFPDPSIARSSDDLTVADLSRLPKQKKPFPALLVSLISVSVLALVLLIVAIIQHAEIFRLVSTLGLDPSSLSVYIQQKNSSLLELTPEQFQASPENNTLEITDPNLATLLSPDNPLIVSGDNSLLVRPTFVSSALPDGRRLVLVTENGELAACSLTDSSALDLTYNPFSDTASSCSLSGFRDKIYKITELYPGYVIDAPATSATPAVDPLDSPQTLVAFIYVDGSVDYLPLSTFASSDSATVSRVNISGIVRDILPVTSTYAQLGEHSVQKTSVFVMSDGSVLPFDASMLRSVDPSSNSDSDSDSE